MTFFLALTFVSPLLLIGLVSAAIPLLLHLLSNVKAQEVHFPTLRFLKAGVEKTARRRRIRHWLLLILRSALLALLALAVAEPVSRATGGWLAGRDYAAVVILDNSFSMAARGRSGGRFSQARSGAAALLGGAHKPSMAAVMTTNGGQSPRELTARMEGLREQVDNAAISFGPSRLVQRVSSAVKLLAGQSAPQKSIYIFSDLQRVSFAGLVGLEPLTRAGGIHLLIIDTSTGRTNSVGISSLEIGGRRVVDQALEITATLVNSASTDRVVDVVLRIEGRRGQEVQRLRKSLRPQGVEGSIATVRFYHAFDRAGPAAGRVTVEAADDDLPLDNSRGFSLTIAPRIGALIVSGPSGGDSPSMQPAAMLQVALEPFPSGGEPWSIVSRAMLSDAFTAADLADTDVAFFCNVPSFTAAQAGAITRFVRRGGTAVIFPGPDTDVRNYNRRFIDETGAMAMLPGRLDVAVGQVGPTADALPVDWVDLSHPYFAGLWPALDDYLGVLVQRYYRLAASMQPGRVLMRLNNSAPILLVRTFGKGRCVLSTTTASPRWSNFPTSSLFLPVMARVSLFARDDAGANHTYLSGSRVAIRPPLGGNAPEGAAVSVTPPGASGTDAAISLPLIGSDLGPVAVFSDTSQVGIYTWKLTGMAPGAKAVEGSFVVNPYGRESRLESFDGGAFAAAMKKRGMDRVYVGRDLEAVNLAALADTKGRNWWDVIMVGVIFLLITESIVAGERHRISTRNHNAEAMVSMT